MTTDERQRLVEVAPHHGIRLLPSAAPLAGGLPKKLARPEALDVLSARVDVLARLGSADHDLVLMRGSVASGITVPLHSHPGAESVFVVSGGVEFYLESKGWITLGPEQAAYAAPNARHALRNSGNAPALLLMVTTARIARFFATIGSPAEELAPRPPSQEEFAALPGHLAQFGFWRAEPKENASIGLALDDRSCNGEETD
jgi:quercetin dioxygenase-like cupin family protein